MMIFVPTMTVLLISNAAAGLQYSKSIFETPAQDHHPMETHRVVTTDGYVLTVIRIISQYNFSHTESSNGKASPPVLIAHAQAVNADSFTLFHDTGWLYGLVDSGFDVWLLNTRGTTQSRDHISLHPNSKEYWNFGWHEMATYDLPATIDHILTVRKDQKKIIYIGHSRGGGLFLILTSTLAQYNDKILSAHLLAPAASFQHFYFKRQAILLRTALELSKMINPYKVPGLALARHALPGLCHTAITSTIIMKAVNQLDGPDPSQMSQENFEKLCSVFPQDMSMIEFTYTVQLFEKQATLHHFDYGVIENIKRYKSIVAPPYDLDTIRVPIYLYCGANDRLVSPKDMDELARKLRHSFRRKYLIPHPQWNHIDFLSAINATQLLLPRLLSDIKENL